MRVKLHSRRAGLLGLCVAVATSLNSNIVLAETRATAPTVSAEEAPIKHWRMPEIERRFMDISELAIPYISTSPEMRDDGIPVGSLQGDDAKAIAALAQELSTGEQGAYDSLLIAKNNTLLFESYFKRGRVDLSHPQSSATKSYTSLALGRAIQLGYLTMADLDKPVISFLENIDRTKLVSGAEKVTLFNALTMTTGIQIEEEVWDNLFDDTQRVTGQGEIQAILEESAPITDETQVFNYGIGPQFVMQVIDAVVPGGARAFVTNEVFGKLGITNYGWRTAPSGLPVSGSGVSVTSRDMLKMGMLVINDGVWEGEQLISKAYLDKATRRQIMTGDDDIYGGGDLVSKQGYGFFWWGTELRYGDKQYYTFSAQGGGGMYIIVIKELDLIVVVTAHERNDITQQITAERIVPILAKH